MDPRATLTARRVFPHALAEDDSGGSYEVEAGVGVFVARRVLDGVEIVSEARFVRRGEADWMPVPATSMQGWSVWGPQPPPSTTLELRLTSTGGTAAASTQMILGALRTRVVPAASCRRAPRES